MATGSIFTRRSRHHSLIRISCHGQSSAATFLPFPLVCVRVIVWSVPCCLSGGSVFTHLRLECLQCLAVLIVSNDDNNNNNNNRFRSVENFKAASKPIQTLASAAATVYPDTNCRLDDKYCIMLSHF